MTHDMETAMRRLFSEGVPEFADEKIKSWDRLQFKTEVFPFVKEHRWIDNASIDIFRVVGTQHVDYAGLTWKELLEKGKRMDINLRLYLENPGYYHETTKKQPPCTI